MEKQLLEYVTAKTKDLTSAPSCCQEAKDAAAAWLAAVGTPQEKEQTAKYLQELKEDVTSIDGLIAFAGSAFAEKEFGKEAAQGLLAHAKEIKAAGAKYCDCAACTAALAIIEKENELLK